jgi:hypothetical protein
MTPDPDLVDKLRIMFVEGATPTRLIEQISGHHAGDSGWPEYVESYFRSAFSVILLDREWHDRSSDGPISEKTAKNLNSRILHEMVGLAYLWRDKVASIPNGESWLDGLKLSRDELALIDSIQPESEPALANSWSTLSERTREFIRRSMINSQAYYERTEVLLRLVERLQQQVAHAESAVTADKSS